MNDEILDLMLDISNALLEKPYPFLINKKIPIDFLSFRIYQITNNDIDYIHKSEKILYFCINLSKNHFYIPQIKYVVHEITEEVYFISDKDYYLSLRPKEYFFRYAVSLHPVEILNLLNRHLINALTSFSVENNLISRTETSELIKFLSEVFREVMAKREFFN